MNEYDYAERMMALAYQEGRVKGGKVVPFAPFHDDGTAPGKKPFVWSHVFPKIVQRVQDDYTCVGVNFDSDCYWMDTTFDNVILSEV